MKTLDNANLKGKKALIRVDFNVPLNDELKVTDDTRIQSAKPTIQKAIEKGAAVILMSHLGRPKGRDEKFTLKNIIGKVSEVLETEVKFAEDCVGKEALEASKALKAGEVLLLENLRFHSGEKAGDKEFAEQLAQHADVYVNDAFGTAHRAHASTAVIAQFFEEKYFGDLLAKEINNFDKVLRATEKPVTAILGGAKVSSKITVIESMLDKIDNLIIGGGMTYTFIKAKGGEIGDSLVEPDYEKLALELIEKAKEKNVNLYLPTDSVVASGFSADADKKVEAVNAISDDWMGLDIGPETTDSFTEVILDSKIILWNGPMGVFEFERFAEGTKAVGQAVAEATKKGAFSLVGGGDSVAAAKKYKLEDQVSYISTGGGAMLEMLEGKTLPGIAAIEENIA